MTNTIQAPLNLPSFETLQAITDLTDQVQILLQELEQANNELLKTKQNYQVQLLQDEKILKQKLQTQFKRQSIRKEIESMRQQERKLKESINQKLQQILEQNNITNQIIKDQLEQKIISKISQNMN